MQTKRSVRILYELAQCCAQIANTDLCELYIQDEEGVYLVLKETGEQPQIKCRKVKRPRRNPMHMIKLVDVNETNIGEIHFNSPVSERDKQIINVICTWAGGSLHYAQNFAAKLVEADRASLFLVDSKNHELYARIFDVGKDGEELEKINKEGHKEIRVIGVVQMVNKREGVFTKSDEDSFEMFAVYCGLALHHAKLYDKIRRSEQALALYVSCLCHDLDHRGKNNAYMKSMMTPLASIYTTSVMEHHHFNQTVTILQQDGHNILKSMTSSEYKQALSLIKHCILATDLALFFSNKAELNKIVDSGKYDVREDHHRRLTQAILMTGCDLIASAKPWYIQTETVKVIFEEFYEQVGFMRGICLPCYDLIAKVIPESAFLRDQCEYNAKKWEELAAEQAELNKQKSEEGQPTAEEENK
ncbi:3'5'-cyclic nucleotide phosphodiesterase [Teladorsagia circumcincta]|uniref:3'5'-cyclic nucleotide phosphodiesterase n=1 Tax=Teladorsagia circumcincta TaxID=45464 RepID=A0A2G9V6D7_TELCI|nr:3'5'-cyclic nucleotide phosphodiesterase [Teladorsagia circumcincta]